MRFFLFLIFFLTTLSISAGTLYLQESAPIFERPSMDAKVLRTQKPGVIETKDKAFSGFTNRHPLAIAHTFYPLPSGEFISPELLCEPGRDNELVIVQTLPPQTLRIFCTFVCGVALTVMILLFLRLGNPKSVKQESLLLIAILVLLRVFLLLNTLLAWSNFVAAAADENGYFDVATGMLAGDFATPWRFTVGNGILYIPFILISGAKNYYDIAFAYSYFSGFVLAPGALVLGFLILRRLGFTNLKAAIPMLVWAVLPFFFFHIELWNGNIFQSLFTTPGESQWFFYGTIINAGFNAMSDTPSLCAVLGSIALLLYMPPKRRFVLLLGCLYGFACLLRINNIFFAPLLAWLALGKFPGVMRNAKLFGELFACAVVGFFAVFGFQLWVNFHQFGNALTFGYILHATDLAENLRPNAGFTLQTFLTGQNIRFLAGANHTIWVLGISGMLLLKNPKLRITFALWGVPIIYFFFGYSHTGCDARRFIVVTLPAMLSSCVALECWNTMSRRELVTTLSLFCGATLFTMPYPWNVPILPFNLPVDLKSYLYIIPIALFVWGTRFISLGRWQSGLLCTLYPLLLLFGHAYLFAMLLAFILLRALCSRTLWSTLNLKKVNHAQER
ncbi:MAG: hypothetical protein LBM70_06895 [Victivallales bacterium]|jgi:hypothetical protein|nr:hypothetical protein [Victivallales bacterium]